MHEVTYALDHITLKAVESGQGAPSTLIALHGWLDNANSFHELRTHFDEYHFVALDLAGHGHSDHRPPGDTYYIWENVSDLLNLMDLHGYGKVSLIAHSMGASVATLFAAMFPERVETLFLIEGLAPLAYPEEDLPRLMADAMIKQKRLQRRTLRPYPDIETAIEVRMSSRWPVGRQAAEWLVERGIGKVDGGYTWCSDHRLMLPSVNRMSEKQVLAMLKSVQCPVKVYLGHDGIYAPEWQTRMDQVKDLDVLRFAGNHHLHMEPDAAKKIAEHILRSLTNR